MRISNSCANLNSQDSVLDVGRTCKFSFLLKKKKLCNYTGIDFYEEFIKISKKNFIKTKIQNF